MLALVTSSAAAGLDPDLPPLVAAFGAAPGGSVASVERWDDPDVDWSRFDAALLRSTWDYVLDLEAFLTWAERTATATTLHNPLAAVRWNCDKRYLAELAGGGVDVVPTVFVAPGDEPPLPASDAVVKPSVGAGSNGARRCAPGEVADHVTTLHRQGATAMIQPYVDTIDRHGETALCFLPGEHGSLEYSHAFGKAAILTGDGPEWDGDLVAREDVAARVPSPDERSLADAVLSAPVVTSLGPLAYARVDVVPGPDGPMLMELELIEPSMYFDLVPGAAARAAARWAALVMPSQRP